MTPAVTLSPHKHNGRRLTGQYQFLLAAAQLTCLNNIHGIKLMKHVRIFIFAKTLRQCLKLYDGVLSQPSPCSSLRLQKSSALSYRKRCLCIGLKRASSFMRVGPFLWPSHTLNEPCISTRPSSQMSPCRQKTVDVSRRENATAGTHKVQFSSLRVDGFHLITCDGDLMHGVIDGFEQVQHGRQCPLKFRRPFIVCAVF